MKNKQSNIQVGDRVLLEINYNDKDYYPITYTYKNILSKSKQSIKQLQRMGCNDIVKLSIDYGHDAGGIHSTQCISKGNLIKVLNNSKIGGLSCEQKNLMNSLLKYLDQDLIDANPRFIDEYSYEISDNYSDFERDSIDLVRQGDSSLEWQKCTNCNKYYPLHTNFFSYNSRQHSLGTCCHNCMRKHNADDNTIYVIHPDSELNNIYNKHGGTVYSYYKEHDTINIYKHYIETDMSAYPKVLKNKNDYLKIINYLYTNGKITKNMTSTLLMGEHRLSGILTHLRMSEIYSFIFGDHPKEYPWHYENYRLPHLSINDAKNIFNNYINEKGIIIEDIYNFNYYEIARASRIGKTYCSDILGFVMEYYNHGHPAYKFNIASVNYWKDKKRRNIALKHLIENDMKLETDKIPLYLTVTSIRNIGTVTMYGVLKKYYNSLYEWVNDIYPGKFNEKDFDINYMRNEFDSIDENIVHDILKSSFSNVIYNPRNTDDTIKLVGKVPDWLVFTEKGCVIVEYFGLWSKQRNSYNSRTEEYIKSSKDKMQKYKQLIGYDFLYIFPEDLNDDFKGLRNKIDKLI